jgi:hypothetical protein
MIPRHTARSLDEPEDDEFEHLQTELVYESWGDDGWIIHCSGEPNLIAHPELADLLRFAYERGFAYVRLDSGGMTLPEACGLPTFSW